MSTDLQKRLKAAGITMEEAINALRPISRAFKTLHSDPVYAAPAQRAFEMRWRRLGFIGKLRGFLISGRNPLDV